MSGTCNYLVILSLISVLLISFCGCLESTPPDKTTQNNEQILVAVSIPPQKAFAKAVGGERVDVISMLPPNANPHTYELTTGQLKELSAADMYAAVGSGIEFERTWMDKIKSVNPKMNITNCSEGIEFIYTYQEKGDYPDPHIWLSPKSARIMSENIYEGLFRISPENREYFQKNLENYISKLDLLDADIKEMLKEKEGSIIIVYHPAWSYFARDYSLVQTPVQDNGKEPSPARLRELIDKAEENNISAVFASPGYSTKSADVIAKETGAEIVFIDPLSEDYINNLRYAAQAFAQEGNL